MFLPSEQFKLVPVLTCDFCFFCNSFNLINLLVNYINRMNKQSCNKYDCVSKLIDIYI